MSDAADDPFLTRFKTHAFHSFIQSVCDLTDKILEDESSLPANTLPLVQRLNRGTKKAKQRIDAVDGPMTSVQAMNELQNAFTQIQQQVAAFQSNKSPNNLSTANDLLDSTAFPIVQRMPKLEQAIDVTAIFEALNSERNQLKKAVKSIDDYGVIAKASIDALLANEGQINDNIKKQDDRITDLVKRTDDAIAQFNSRSIDAERGRDTNFNNAIVTLRKEIEAYTAANKLAVAKQDSELRESATAIIATLEKYKADAASLLQVIGEIGVAAPFDNTARQDRRAAFWLRLFAGAFFTGMVATVVVTAWQLVNQGMAWEYMVFRFMTAIIFIVPAYYFARESSKFQDEADRNRRLQLELASIGPFIENLEASKRALLREELTRKYFNANSVSRELEKPLDPMAIVDALKEAIKAIKR